MISNAQILIPTYKRGTPSPPLPLSAINFKWSLISLYEAVICGENTREVAKNLLEYFDS